MKAASSKGNNSWLNRCMLQNSHVSDKMLYYSIFKFKQMSLSNSEIIDAVQQLCARKKLRFTAVRNNVLRLLLAEKSPCKAYTLLARLQSNKTQPTAIYRALDFLLQHGFAHKIHSQNSYLACRHPRLQHNCYFIICRHCGCVQECCNANATRAIAQTAKQNNFQAPQAFLEILADCKKCASR